MAFKLPPPPKQNDLQGASWQDWFFKLQKAFTTAGSTLWNAIDFTGSNLTDIQTRNHNDLQNIQGGTTTERYHLTASQQTGLQTNNGYADKTQSTMSFVNGTRTFTITPVGASYDVWSFGVHLTITTAKSVVISNTEGLHYIYFDTTGTLIDQTVFDITLFTQKGITSILYWDATNAKQILFGDERHGRVMDSQTHVYLHETVHTVYEYGLALSSFVVDGNGNSASHAEFAAAGGSIWDEDINLIITAGSPQTLSPIAQIPVYYRSGVSGVWRQIAAGNFPLAYANPGTRADWNQFTGGSWQLTEVTNLDCVLMHYFATNDTGTNQIIGIVGQTDYDTVAHAQAGALVEILSIITTGLPTLEFLPIATVIFQTANGYANTPKSRVRSTDTGGAYVDWRTTRVVTTTGGGGGIPVWGTITGTLSSQTDLQTVLTGLQAAISTRNIAVDGEDGPEPIMIPGIPGPQGTPGVTGPKGPIGFGLDGEDGQDGMAVPGVPGPQGTPGIPGTTGPQGLGFDGTDGEDGMSVPGPRGLQGSQGVQGVPGIGLDGLDGEDGIAIQGKQGVTGSQGPLGPAVFLEAEPGEEGMMGPPGPAGSGTGTSGDSSNLVTTVLTVAVDTSHVIASYFTVTGDLTVFGNLIIL